MTANAAARIGGDQSPQRPPHPPDPSAPDVIEAVARLRRLVPAADPLARLPDVHPASIPAHVAMIMDGNGRWAQERGFPRIFGHRNGAAAVRAVVEECGRLGIGALTLFSFSSENWKRPADEVDALMRLCIEYLEGESRRLIEERIRFRVIGERSGLPAQVVGAIERLEAATRDLHGPTLCLAINYGGRAEIASAARRLARRAAQGSLDPDAIDEHALARELWTAGMPDPDLLIRTAGESRLSNFLLWQVSYAELHVCPAYWPDFGVPELHEAIRDFARRRRRFGSVEPAAAPAPVAPGA